MRSEFIDGFWVGFIIGAVVLGSIGLIRISIIKSEAIATGAAHYVVTDTNNGKTEFLWITNGGAK